LCTQLPAPSQVPVFWQVVPDAGYTHAPPEVQLVAAHPLATVLQGDEQQDGPPPSTPQAPLAHWSFAVQDAPPSSCGVHTWLLQK
jgi:hypothetical protein